MSRTALLVLLALALCSGTAATAQDIYSYRASFSLGLGGSWDVEPSNDLDNTAFQLGFAWVTDVNTLVGVRYGQVSMAEDDGDFFGGRSEADLQYVTIAGEYLLNEGYFRSGVYLGLGYYQLDDDPVFAIDDESTIGLAIGSTGDFQFNKRLSLLLEFSAHYADFEEAQFFVFGHAGLAFRF